MEEQGQKEVRRLALLVVVCALTPARADEDAMTGVRGTIASALEADAPPWAGTVRTPEATVTRVATPPWFPGKVWRVE